MEWTGSLDQCMDRIRRARKDMETLSLGYHGNIVDLWYIVGRVSYCTCIYSVDTHADHILVT